MVYDIIKVFMTVISPTLYSSHLVAWWQCWWHFEMHHQANVSQYWCITNVLSSMCISMSKITNLRPPSLQTDISYIAKCWLFTPECAVVILTCSTGLQTSMLWFRSTSYKQLPLCYMSKMWLVHVPTDACLILRKWVVALKDTTLVG